MSRFYNLPKDDRRRLVEEMEEVITRDIEKGNSERVKEYASDEDTYIRKNTYLIIGKLYHERRELRQRILTVLRGLFKDKDTKVRQTAVYAFGEIGKADADILGMLELALNDTSLRNAVVGALKRMGEKNPTPTLKFARKFLHHPDPEIRRRIVHGIELRGRTHPEEILPLLKELQNDPDKKVRKMIVHVLSQISYKKGCLEKVVSDLKMWENKEIVEKALKEILDVHKRYKRFSAKSYDEARYYIEEQFKK